jgi:hypothetical protein
MANGEPKLRWFQFSLRTLLLLTVIAAIGCLVGPLVWHKLFPPKSDFDELIDLITSTIEVSSSESSLRLEGKLEIGGGQHQEFHEQSDDHTSE